MNKKYSEEEKATILKKHSYGEPISLIAKQFNVSRTTIYRWIKDNNDNIPRYKQKVNMKIYHELERKYLRQKKIIQILQSSPCLVNSPLDIKVRTSG